MSYFFYIHRDLTGVPDVWKVGVALTPYSAVRARQKYCWKSVCLDYLWFGEPWHIDKLELLVKQTFRYRSGSVINNAAAQTELLSMHIEPLLEFVECTIRDRSMHIKRIELAEPYAARNSGECPLRIPQEKDAGNVLHRKVKELWYADDITYAKPNQFEELFEIL